MGRDDPLPGDWVRVSPNPRRISRMVRLRGAGPAAYCFMTISYDGNIVNGKSMAGSSLEARLFPLRDNVRWTCRVHEQILPSLEREGIPMRGSRKIRETRFGFGETGTR